MPRARLREVADLAPNTNAAKALFEGALDGRRDLRDREFGHIPLCGLIDQAGRWWGQAHGRAPVTALQLGASVPFPARSHRCRAGRGLISRRAGAKST